MLMQLKQKIAELPDRFNGFIAARPWDKYTGWVFVVIGLLALVTNVYAAWHIPLGMADESWFIYLIREQIPLTLKGSFFTLYLKAFSGCSFLTLRYLALGLTWFATGMLALSICYLFKGSFSKRGLVSFMFCGVCWYAMLLPQTVAVPFYLTFEYFWGLLAVAALFFAFAAQSSLWQCVGFAASGFCSTLLFLDMFPAAPMVLLVFLSACCVGVKAALFWMSGVLFGFGIFFVFLLSPSDCLQQILAAFTAVDKDQHDKMLLVRWTLKTAFYFVTRILGYCVAICALVEIPSKNRITKFYFGLVLALGVAYVAAVEIIQGSFFTQRTFSIAVLYTMFALTVWMYVRQQRLDAKKLVAFVMMFLAPVLLSLGTNGDFSLRAVVYSMTLAFPILILSNIIGNRYLSFFVFLLVALFAVRFFVQFNAVSWATYEKFFAPSQRLSGYAIDVTASSRQARDIRKIKELTSESPYLVGSSFCWQYIVVLNKKPVQPFFYLASSDLRDAFSRLNLTKYDVAFVVNRKNPEKDFFPGWIELYREHFDAKNIEQIEFNESEDILLFR